VSAPAAVASQPVVRVGPRTYPVVWPNAGDPRLHIAGVILTIHVLGQVALDFRVSVPQILAAILTCAVIEVAVTARRDRALVWPASAMLTGSGVALILRDVGTETGDHWTFRSWWLFAAVAALSLATKYLIRWRGTHLFNPSNVGLVIAFLALGSDRIEPLDFWWAPFGVPMLLAYVVIITGGLLVTERLGLLEMAGAFWLTFAACTASLALAGHCITALWSIMPVCDGHFWWVIVTSPEVLVFLFFMITDPRTVPAGRVPRIWFGVAVAVVSTVLLAPQTTEFGAKVGLLGGLAFVCAARPLVGRIAGPAGRRQVMLPAGRLALGGLALAAGAVVLVGVAAAGAPARTTDQPVEAEALPDPQALVPAVDPDRVPRVSVDPDVAPFGTDLLGPGAQAVGVELIRALDIEALALRERDADILPAIDHGRRLREMRGRVEEAASGAVTVDEHRFDEMHLRVVPGGQGSARPGIEGRGTVVEVSYDEDGGETGRTAAAPFELLFVMRTASDGRWLLVDVVPLEE
jgi:hypothetical protein